MRHLSIFLSTIPEIWRHRQPRFTLLVAIFILAIPQIFILLFARPVIERFVLGMIEEEAYRVTLHLHDHFGDRDQPLHDDFFAEDFDQAILPMLEHFQIRKLDAFSPEGEIIFSTDPAIIGQQVTATTLYENATAGIRSFDIRTSPAENENGMLAIAEIMVPMTSGDQFLGAYIAYYDISETISRLTDIAWVIMRLFFIGSGVLLGGVFIVAMLMTRTEQERQAEQRKFRGLFEDSPISLWEEDFSAVKHYIAQLSQMGITDFQRYFNEHPHHVYNCMKLVKITYVNQQTLSLFNAADKKELLAHLDVIFKDAFPMFLDEMVDIAAGKTVFEKEGINYTVDGRRLNVIIRWSAIPGYEENLERVLVSVIDITQRKKSAQETQLQAAALNAAANAIVITDAQGIIRWVNPAFTRLTGYAAEEAIGQNPRILKSGYNDDAFYNEMWQTILDGNVWMGTDLINKRKDGRHYHEQMTISPVRDETGEIINFIAIKEDITARKKTAAELAEARDTALRASRMKSEFLANMSHEIRTPLNGVIGMTALLLDTSLDDTQRQFTETIRSSGDALLAIINDILDFSKIEAGKLEIESQPFNLSQCIEEALDLIAPKAEEKGLELVYHIDPGVRKHVIGDVTRLRQVLVNLLGNGIKFTENGEVVVSVIGQRLDNAQQQLYFAIRDSGIGIPREKRRRLFKAFSQVDASTSRRYGGTGLGLAISKQLVEMMGGRIWVDSMVGEGSTFHFSIRIGVVDIGEESDTVPGRDELFRDKQLLLVDDNELNRLILQTQLENWGLAVTSCASGQDALEQLNREQKFDLMVLDLQMKPLDGRATVAAVEQQLGGLPFPVIMLTSLGNLNGDANDARYAAYLTKPVKPQQFHNHLVQCLKNGRVTSMSPLRGQAARFDAQMAERHPLRILLAEDNMVNQKVTLLMLSRLGYIADIAGNGLEALEAVRRQPYDVVLMDIQMPEMDGLTATERILEEQSTTDRPWLIAMTANAMIEDRERYLSAGMDDYVSKPVKLEQLIEVLWRVRKKSPES